MLNFLVETKQEYTTQLINVLSPLIFEGLKSIYDEAQNASTPENILKNFQCFLKRIPKWNNDIINKESLRIMNNSKSYTWLEDLIKATLKANIIVLTYNPSIKSQVKVDPNFYKNIQINDFIHKIYIECAREIWNNPYLFYHNYPPIELKRNQRDTILLVKDCIKEAIRKLLPIKHILQIYLGEEMEGGSPDDHFEKSISEIEEKNLTKLIKKDLESDKIFDKPKEFLSDKLSEKSQDISEKNQNISEKNQNISEKYQKISEKNQEISEKPVIISNSITSATNKTVGTQILDILNNQSNIKFSDNESETSISFHPNETYQEVFSNGKPSTVNNKVNNTNNKFFANYLNV